MPPLGSTSELSNKAAHAHLQWSHLLLLTFLMLNTLRGFITQYKTVYYTEQEIELSLLYLQFLMSEMKTASPLMPSPRTAGILPSN